YKVLCSMKKVAEERSAASGTNGVLIGQIVLVVGLFVLQFLFLWFFRPATYERKANVVFILIMITGLVLFTSLVVHTGYLHVYMIPYAILPIMVRTFFDSRTALFAHIITVLISSTIVAYPYEFLLIQIAAGMTSVYSLRDLTQRSQLVLCSILVVITYCVMYLGISLIQEGFMNRIDWHNFAYFLINGGFMLTSYLLIYLFEWMFGYTSNVTLVELSNINNPLLREFSETCPGSFQHSMQVSNLATAAAQEINANVQLVRTGALYHDIGKMCNPIYFTENQSGVNPHDELTPEESAKIIISHVSEGLKLAHKHGLPLVIRDCIRSHHGNGPVRFFYSNFMKEHPDEPVPDAFFYKGSNPASKETAILMMADALEASSRSLKEYSESEISLLVERIINMQFQEGAFKNVPITFRDLEKIKTVFKSKLQTIYHTRIAYPEMPAINPPLVSD
ncbi:MAG: HDIG domain-containing protein, partial [Bacteroidales bacterium]|nr:HDIG domain-containing protein [Bacteroidales bacterium]